MIDDPRVPGESPSPALPANPHPISGVDLIGDIFSYEPTRRLQLYIQSSIKAGIQWAAFEPNAEPLWAQLRLSVGTFMQNLFLQGDFAGTAPADAYFVKCDAENNPPSSVAEGVVNIDIGFAPIFPAEFVVIQIQQMTCASCQS